MQKNLLNYSVYSIPELNKREFKIKELSKSGCYPTSIQIPLVPLIKKNLIKINNISMTLNQDIQVQVRI